MRGNEGDEPSISAEPIAQLVHIETDMERHLLRLGQAYRSPYHPYEWKERFFLEEDEDRAQRRGEGKKEEKYDLPVQTLLMI